MVFNPSAGAYEDPGPFFFFQNNQYSVHLQISCWFFPSNDILTVFPIQMGPPDLEKKIFEGFLPYMGMAAILVM